MITMPKGTGNSRPTDLIDLASSESEALLDLLTADRDDFVIDVRDGQRTESYLRVAPRSVEPLIPSKKAFRSQKAHRAVDIIVALTGLVLTAPLFLMSATAVAVSSRGPVVFRQERVGINGKIFRCMKFRSMRADAEQSLSAFLDEDEAFRTEWLENQKVENDNRITRVGKFLRRTSLDELPQFINVLRGEMSIVGPRPVVPPETVRYGDDLAEVLRVRPGLTGLWQVSGRNNVSYAERVQLDLAYVRGKSVRQDISIMIRTFGILASQEGVS